MLSAVTAMEFAAIATVPSGAIMRVERIIAPQIAICSNPIGSPIFTMQEKMDQSNVQRSFRLMRRLSERKHAAHNFTMQITRVASAVPNAAPGTPRNWINKRLNSTSRPHMAASKMAGVLMLPLHCSMDPARLFN